MRYEDPRLRELLAGEYVLGTLRGAARRRFEGLLGARPSWRREVAFWEARLGAMAESLRPVEPPARLWRAIEARIAGSRAASRLDRVWKALAALSTGLALALVGYIGLRPQTPPAGAEVAVLLNQTAQPGWVVNLVRATDGSASLRVAVLPPLTPAAGKSFELWMLPAGGAAPVSLGLLPQQGQLQVALPAIKAAVLIESGALAVSLEPEGGSPTGAPTGPVLYQGKLTAL